MNEALVAIFFIAIPATLIATLIMIIFRNKIYALRSIALYLFIAGTVILSNDIETSISMLFGGVLILFSSFLMQLKSRRANKILMILSAILAFAIIFLYVFIWKFNLYTYAIYFDFSEKCKNQVNDSLLVTSPYGSWHVGEGTRCNVEIQYNISSFIPLNKDVKVYLCESSKYPVNYGYKRSSNVYIVSIPPYIDDSSLYYICVTYNDECGDCIARKSLTEQ